VPTATISAASDIDAPLARVWSILSDLSSYAEWNPFTPRIDASLRIGTPVVLHVAMKPGKRLLVQREVCTRNDAAKHELGWGVTMLTPHLLRAERIQRLEALPGGGTRYFTADTFSGALTPIVMAFYRADIQRGFDSVASALKQHAERRA
jgi:hypothetical protein